MQNHKTPICLLLGWLLLETIPSFVSPYLSDDVYSGVYNYTEDWASVLLAAALYAGLSYTSTLLKAASLFVLIVAFSFALANIIIDILGIQDESAPALFIAISVWLGAIFALRFIFHFDDGDKHTPTRRHIYLIIRKPHSLLDMLALIYSGLGGGFVAYHDGKIWKFTKSEGCLVKEFDPKYYVGKRMIDCGEATEEKLADLDTLVGARWSIFNNCFSVFAGWRRKWRH